MHKAECKLISIGPAQYSTIGIPTAFFSPSFVKVSNMSGVRHKSDPRAVYGVPNGNSIKNKNGKIRIAHTIFSLRR